MANKKHIHPIKIEGNNNTIILGNNNKINAKSKKEDKPKDAISEEQASEIKLLVQEIGKIYEDAGETNKTAYSSIYSKLYRKFKVTSYKNIKKSDYNDVILYLRRLRTAAKSKLKNKNFDAWRTKAYADIYTKIGIAKIDKKDFLNYLTNNLQRTITSLKDLNDEELKKIHYMVMKKL